MQISTYAIISPHNGTSASVYDVRCPGNGSTGSLFTTVLVSSSNHTHSASGTAHSPFNVTTAITEGGMVTFSPSERTPEFLAMPRNALWPLESWFHTLNTWHGLPVAILCLLQSICSTLQTIRSPGRRETRPTMRYDRNLDRVFELPLKWVKWTTGSFNQPLQWEQSSKNTNSASNLTVQFDFQGSVWGLCAQTSMKFFNLRLVAKGARKLTRLWHRRSSQKIFSLRPTTKLTSVRRGSTQHGRRFELARISKLNPSCGAPYNQRLKVKMKRVWWFAYTRLRHRE